MEYIICEQFGCWGFISLSEIAYRMACSDINDGGYLHLNRFEQGIDARLEMLLLAAYNNNLRIMTNTGVAITVDEVIANVPPASIPSVKLSAAEGLFTTLPVLNKWGENFDYSFTFNKNDGELTNLTEDKLLQIGRKNDPSLPALSEIDLTLEGAATWLTAATGRAWTALSVLRRLFELAELVPGTVDAQNMTGAYFISPKGTACGIYKETPESGWKFQFLHCPKILPLSEENARNLLRYSVAKVDTVFKSFEPEVFKIIIEPVGDSFPLTVDMVRISNDRLLGLHAIDGQKETRLMPVYPSFLWINEDEMSEEDNDRNTCFAFDRISMEYSWFPGEWESLITEASDSHSAVVMMLRKIRQRPLKSFYDILTKDYFDHEAAVPVLNIEDESLPGLPTLQIENESQTATVPHTDGPAENVLKRVPHLKKSWDRHSLARLLEESNAPGMSHTKLAEKYGVSRQRIGTLLDKVKPTKPTGISLFVSSNRKK